MSILLRLDPGNNKYSNAEAILLSSFSYLRVQKHRAT